MTTDQETPETIRYTADVVAVTRESRPRRVLRRISGRFDTRRVLLIERGWPPHEGAWALPGGHVDDGEEYRQAGARELWEETGVRVDPEDLREVGIWGGPDRDPRGVYETHAYLAIVPVDTPIAAGDDATNARWWPLNSLPRKLAFDHADILFAARCLLDAIDDGAEGKTK